MQIVKTDKPHSVFSMEADKDYIIARLVNFTGSAFSSRAAYYGQQALEKYMKAFLVQQVGEYPRIHNLLQIANKCAECDRSFCGVKFIEDIKLFNDFIEVGRYGGEASYDPYAKSTKQFKTAGVIIWSDSNIKILDKLVYEIRGKLDFKKIKFSDSLTAIVNEDKKDYLMGTWKLPIKLKDILVVENSYFH